MRSVGVGGGLVVWWYFFFDVDVGVIMVVNMVKGLQLLLFNRGLGFEAHVGEHVVKEILGAIMC